VICSPYGRQIKNKTVYHRGSFVLARKVKFSKDQKLKIIQKYLEGNVSGRELAREFGCNDRTIRHWVNQYKYKGEDIFLEINENQSYSSEFKHMVVQEYLDGRASQRELAIKYNIRSTAQIYNWIKVYNGHKKLKSYKASGGIEVAKGRKTTYEERIEIVESCLKNGQDYNATAAKYNVSYQQVYSWVQKYNNKGISALKDNRGRGKVLEDMDKTEQLEAENKLLKAKLERLQIEIELKKKVDEVLMNLESSIKKKK